MLVLLSISQPPQSDKHGREKNILDHHLYNYTLGTCGKRMVKFPEQTFHSQHSRKVNDHKLGLPQNEKNYLRYYCGTLWTRSHPAGSWNSPRRPLPGAP